ncbi:hypothetical protein VTJ49DRAFT_3133 [Mycothermus thermophilus]|uniref:C2H2-type domain-containing protein n=1 Tax=Humicola insolens TaxID=85995 RepID=A0ABR3V8D7_HUMIN
MQLSTAVGQQLSIETPTGVEGDEKNAQPKRRKLSQQVLDQVLKNSKRNKMIPLVPSTPKLDVTHWPKNLWTPALLNSGTPNTPITGSAKVAGLDLSETDNHGGGRMEMRCSLPPHKGTEVFSTYAEYESHYRQQHTNRCAQCRKNFPSARFLELHIEETHDAFVQARRERGERTYSCFVEGCDRKCSTPQKRKMHLVDKHMYPKNFFFAITRDGIDGRRSLLLEGRRHKTRHSSEPPAGSSSSQHKGAARGSSLGPEQQHVGAAQESIEEATTHDSSLDGHEPRQQSEQRDEEMEDISRAMAALQFVPPSVRFGRGKRSGFAKR